MSSIVFILGYNIDSNYILIDDKILVDTGSGYYNDYLTSKLQENGVNPNDIELIVNTHCHFDHIGGNYHFPDAKVAIHKADAVSIKNKDTLGTSMSVFEQPGNCRVDMELEDGDEIADFKVIHTPGHGGDYQDMKNSAAKLVKLDVKNIYPGHGPMVEGNGKEHLKMSYSLL